MKKEKNENKGRAELPEESSVRKASLLYDEDPATLLARFGIQVAPAFKEACQKCNTR